MKISHQLIGSYVLIIALVVILSAFSIASMVKLESVFSQYRSTARTSLLLADMSQYLGDARRNVFKYRLIGNDEDGEVVHNDLKKLLVLNEKVDGIVTDEEQKSVLYDLGDKAKAYQGNFSQAFMLQGKLNQMVAIMDSLGPSVRKKVTNVAESAYKNNQLDVAYYAGRIQESLLLGRFYARGYLLHNEKKDAERTLAELEKAIQDTNRLVRLSQSQSLSVNSTILREELNQYKSVFSEVYEVVTKRNAFYGEMDKLGPEILGGYTGMFADNEDKQNTLGPQASQTIRNVSLSSWVSGVVITILSIFIALFISRLIIGALSNVTSVMTKLREGDFDVDVTGTERQDEIGQMARSIEQFKNDAKESFLLRQMVNDMPTNVMTIDVKDNLKVNYINNTSVNTLSGLEEHLPVKATELIGQSIDIFHKAPEHQRALLANPANLPHTAKISVGPERMSLLVSAIKDMKDEYVGAMLTWNIITAEEKMGANVEEVVSVLSSAVAELEATAQSMSSMAEKTKEQASNVSNAAEQASSNVSSVAAATEELTASVAEISKQMHTSHSMAISAKDQADSTNQTVESLKKAADSIGEVVTLINNIAEQTNLLALNATIEAARAGDAGKGFAVVANEVKNLAGETAKATDEISNQIKEMQSITSDAVSAISGISETIGELTNLATTVASATEEQNSATQEIAKSIEQAAIGTQEVTTNIMSVSQAAEETGESARQVLLTSNELGQQSVTLKEQVGAFLKAS